MKRFILPLLVVASAMAGGTVFAGGSPAVGVKGKVSGWDKLLPAVYAEFAKPDSHRFTWREPSPTVKQDFRKLSANVTRDVCVVAFGSGPAPAHEPRVVKVTGGRITPSTIVLSPGSRLSFKNTDPFPHQLYEANNPAWGPNPIAPGSTREWAAGATGLHVIRDQLFPSIVMYVVVDANAVEYDFPDREGVFTMTLPPGEYTLKAFFDGKPTGKPIDGVKVESKGVELKEPLTVGGDSK
ncbi:MAG TPA: hypothetical protein VIY73_17800 [Polyangiaceae bacterium]